MGNGGNVVATTERILSGRGLEVPPQSFQPPLPVPASSAASTATPAQAKPLQPDLITRYNLKANLRKKPVNRRHRRKKRRLRPWGSKSRVRRGVRIRERDKHYYSGGEKR